LFDPESLPQVENSQPDQVPTIIQNSEEDEAVNRDISQESDDARREFYENLQKEEEVKRLVAEELKAREVELEAELKAEQAAQQEAEQAAQQEAQEAQIAQLIGNAESALKNLELLKPEGQSAYDYFSQALEIQEDNERAITGLDDIADTYFSFALKALENNDPDKASRHLTDLIKVRPNDPRLDGFLQQITDLKAGLKIEEEKKRLLNELAEAELAKAETELTEAAQVQPTAPKIDTEIESDNSGEESVKTAENTEITTEQVVDEGVSAIPVNTEETPIVLSNETKEVAQAQPKAEVINRVELTSAYETYDSGRYSNKLFDTMLKAANEDEGRAQYILAEMYAAGRGTDQNFAESTFWLKRSLDYVNQNAKYRQPWAEKAMGVIYEKGWYVDSDTARAFRWYQSSAEKGYGPAQYRLGLAYAKGLGVQKDFEQAEFWLKKALSNGHQEAKKALSKIPARN